MSQINFTKITNAITLAMAALVISSLLGEKCKMAKNQNKLIQIASKGIDEIAKTDQLNSIKLSDRESRLMIQNDSLRQAVKSLKGRTKVVIQTIYDTINIPILHDRIVEVESGKALKLPYYESHDDRWLSFKHEITEQGISRYYGIRSVDSLTFQWGERNKPLASLFKGQEYWVSVDNANPNARSYTASSFSIISKRKWYQKPWIWLGVGFVAGVGVSFAK